MLSLLILLALQPPSAASETSWTLASENLQKNEILESWFSVPALEVSKVRKSMPDTKVTILAPSYVEAWLTTQRCIKRGSSIDTGKEEKPPPSMKGLIKVCAQPRENKSFRLIARVEYPTVTRHYSSSLIAVEPSWKLDPTLLGILTAVLGFLVGLLGHIGQKLVDRRLENRDTRANIIQVITGKLASEIADNREQLAEYIEGRKLDPDPLSMAGYNAILGSESAMSFLSTPERREFFPAITALYHEIGYYNDMIDSSVANNIDGEALLAKARSLKKRLDKVRQT